MALSWNDVLLSETFPGASLVDFALRDDRWPWRAICSGSRFAVYEKCEGGGWLFRDSYGIKDSEHADLRKILENWAQREIAWRGVFSGLYGARWVRVGKRDMTRAVIQLADAERDVLLVGVYRWSRSGARWKEVAEFREHRPRTFARLLDYEAEEEWKLFCRGAVSGGADKRRREFAGVVYRRDYAGSKDEPYWVRQ